MLGGGGWSMVSCELPRMSTIILFRVGWCNKLGHNVRVTIITIEEHLLGIVAKSGILVSRILDIVFGEYPFSNKYQQAAIFF